VPAHELDGERRARAVDLTAHYLAHGIRTLVYAVAPERVVIGGGVAELDGLVERTRFRLRAALAGYPGLPEHDAPDFVQPAGLGALAGPRGVLALARTAVSTAGA
jgi:fructokinase